MKPITFEDNLISQKPFSDVKTKNLVMQEQKTVQKQKLKTTPLTSSILQTKPVKNTKQKDIVKPRVINQPPVSPRTSRRPPRMITPSFSLSKKIKSQQGFGVQVRFGDGWRTVSDSALTKRSALGLGVLKTRGRSKASFRIFEVEGHGKKLTFDLDLGRELNKYRKPIVKGKSVSRSNIFIEKNKYRIDTKGEIDEISRKGWSKSRSKWFRGWKK